MNSNTSRNFNNNDVYGSDSNNSAFDQANITNDTYNNRQPMLDSVISPDQGHHTSNIYQSIPDVSSNNNNNNDNTIPEQFNEPTRSYRQPTSNNVPPPQPVQTYSQYSQSPFQSNTFHISSPQTFIYNISATNPDTIQRILSNYPPSTNNSFRPQQ